MGVLSCQFRWYYDYSFSNSRFKLITWPCDLDLWPWRLWHLWLMRVYVLHPHTNFQVFRPYRSEDVAHFVSALVGLWPRRCDLLTLKLVRNVARVMGGTPLRDKVWWYYNYTFSDHRPPSVHQAWSSYDRIRKIWRTMCVSINGLGDPDLLTLKLVRESHLRWVTFVPNLDTLDLCTRRTDIQTDRPAKATLIAPSPWAGA